MIWIIGAALVAILAIALAQPIFAAYRHPDAAPATSGAGAARDIAVYRDQLRSIKEDAASGRIAPDEAERLRAEVGRRLLEADRAIQREATPAESPHAPGRNTQLIGLVGLAAVLTGAFAGYIWLGKPDYADMPLSQRIAVAKDRYDSRPSQSEAETAARANIPPPPAPAADVADLMDRLRTKMAEAPDAQGLRLLADYEARLGDLPAARQAMEQLIAWQGDKATADDHLGLAVMMVDAAGGVITPEAEAEIVAALARDPAHPQARFLRGLLLAQSGREDLTFDIWRKLLEEGPADAPWIQPIRQTIAQLAWKAGEPGYTPPSADSVALPSPDPDAVAAMQDLTPDERAAMIESMVAGLEDRLATEGGTSTEWAQLILSLAMQGDTARAQTILDEARDIFANDPDAQAQLDDAASRSSLR